MVPTSHTFKICPGEKIGIVKEVYVNRFESTAKWRQSEGLVGLELGGLVGLSMK